MRFLLSVSVSIITETLGGTMASKIKASRATPEADFPCPRASAASIDAFGMPAMYGKYCSLLRVKYLYHFMYLFLHQLITSPVCGSRLDQRHRLGES